MNESMWKRAMARIAFAVAVAGCAGVANFGCYAEGPEYGGDGYADGDYPPDAYIATADPFYYDGYATYWYGGRWFYRNGGRWNHYNREPGALHAQRLHQAPGRRTYEAHGGRGRAGGHVGHGGGRR